MNRPYSGRLIEVLQLVEKYDLSFAEAEAFLEIPEIEDDEVKFDA